MPQLIVVVVDDPTKIHELLSAWVKIGVTGATILDSSGLGHLLSGATRDDLPLFPSLEDVLQAREEHHRTVLSVVGDDLDLDRLLAVTESIVGRLDDHHTGIMFAIPVTRVWGLQPKRERW